MALAISLELEYILLSSILLEVEHHDYLSRKMLLKLFAVLARRLAITAGPYFPESSELIANHMAVLMKPDEDFLRSTYPSEPILAEASARLTASYGWGKPLRALNHYVQTGIIDSAGFPGELLTKLVCLMATDRVQHSIPYDPFTEWQYTRPIPVSRFLSSLVTTDRIASNLKHSNVQAKTFVDYLMEVMKGSSLELKDIQRFMDGYVFFAHFINLECTASIQLLARAWNRGAAITCQAYNSGFNHIIPVIFMDANVDSFGPLYGRWNEDQIAEARRSMSYILIKSMNRAAHVANVSPKDKVTNANLIGSLPVQNTYLSIVQDFGMREDDESAVIVDLPQAPAGKDHLKDRYRQSSSKSL